MRLLLLLLLLLLGCSTFDGGLRPGHYRSNYDARHWRYEILVSDRPLNLNVSDKEIAFWFDFFRQDPVPNICVIHHSSMVYPITQDEVEVSFARATPLSEGRFLIRIHESTYEGQEYSWGLEVETSEEGLEGVLKSVLADHTSEDPFAAVRVGEFDGDLCLTTATRSARLNQ